MELIQIKNNSYYIKGKTNIGLYKLNLHDVCLIDCGYESDAMELYSLLEENHFNLKYVIITHSHPDHSGAAKYLMNHTNCKLMSSKIERAFLRNDKLDIGFLYGGYPLDEYDNRLMHIEEHKDILPLMEIPRPLWYFKIPGHHYDMFGIKTPDDVFYVSDGVGNPNVISREHILLIYNVEGYLNSLDMIESFKGVIVPAHLEPETSDVMKDIIKINRDKINEILNIIVFFLSEKRTVEDIVHLVFEHYNLFITYNKYLLINSTIRSYLSYLSNKGIIKTMFEDNYMYFIKK